MYEVLLSIYTALVKNGKVTNFSYAITIPKRFISLFSASKMWKYVA